MGGPGKTDGHSDTSALQVVAFASPSRATRAGGASSLGRGMDRDLLKAPTIFWAVRRHWVLSLLLVILWTALGAGFARTGAKTSTAVAAIVVQQPSSGLLEGDTATYVANQAQILRLPSVAQEISTELAAQKPPLQVSVDALLKHLTISTDAASSDNLIRISYTDPDPTVAQRVANTVIPAYVKTISTQAGTTTQSTLASLNAAIDQLTAQIQAAPVSQQAPLIQAQSQLLLQRVQVENNVNGSGGIAASSPARLPSLVRTRSETKYALIGFVLGCLVAAGASYLLSLRRRFGERFEPEAVLQAPLITEVPHFGLEKLPSDLPAFDRPDSAAAEAFRFASTSFAIRSASSRRVGYAVVSAASGAGKSTVTANLAATSASVGRRVLVVDGDLEGRRTAALLLGDAAVGAPGLVQVIDGELALTDAVRQANIAPGIGFDVLPSGGPRRGASELFASKAATDLIATMCESYDLVLVDLPPLLNVAYASQLASNLDTALVVLVHESSVRQLEELSERLQFLGQDVVGYIYNKSPLRRGLGLRSQLHSGERTLARPAVPLGQPTGFLPGPKPKGQPGEDRPGGRVASGR
jgi:Mrp family chromosome partitioning ATPase/capsular polysaccharide biosynthesis protein